MAFEASQLNGMLSRISTAWNKSQDACTVVSKSAHNQRQFFVWSIPFLVGNQTSCSFAAFFWLAPLMIWERSPTGMAKGKSREASMMAKKIHHPAMEVTNVKAPAA